MYIVIFFLNESFLSRFVTIKSAFVQKLCCKIANVPENARLSRAGLFIRFIIIKKILIDGDNAFISFDMFT